jgi:septal ring factor EnvC (AmiA/AmiB activator)
MAVVVSCSTGPSEKELSLLEERRMAMEAAEKQVAQKKAENARLERQLANKKAELQALESKLSSTQQNLAGDQ